MPQNAHQYGSLLYIGIDLHRRSIVVCTLDQNGTIVERRTMKTDPDLVTAYFRQWPAHEHRAVVAPAKCLGPVRVLSDVPHSEMFHRLSSADGSENVKTKSIVHHPNDERGVFFS
jgi:hypothetical protein